MAISILLLGGALLIFFAIAVLLVIVGIVTRRPGPVAIVGLVCLLGIGGVFVSFIGMRSVSHSQVYYNGTEAMPQVIDWGHHEISMPSAQSIQESTSWSIMLKPMLLFGIVALVAFFAVRASGSSLDGRRSNWPALLVGPVIGLLLLISFVGFFFVTSSKRIQTVPRIEALPQDMSALIDSPGNAEFMATQQQLVDEVRAQSQHLADAKRHRDEAVADAKRRHDEAVADAKRKSDFAVAEAKQRSDAAAAEAKRHGDAAAADAHRQQVNAIQEQLRQEAMQRVAILNANLQHQLATMDINELIEIFTAPKINLGPVLVEVATNTAQPAPAIGAPAIEAPTIEVAPAMAPPAAIAPAAPPAPAAAIAVAAGSTEATVAEAAAASAEPNTSEKAAGIVAPDSEGKPSQEKDSSAKITIKKRPDGSAEAVVAVAPSSSPETLEPAWVHDKAGMYGQDYREIVSTDEYATEDEARRAMDVLLMIKTAERVRSLMGEQALEHRRPSIHFYQGNVTLDGNLAYDQNFRQWWDQDIRMLNTMGIGMNEIRRSVVRDQYMASRESSRALNTMYKQYTQAQFTPWFDDQLKKHWRAYKRQAQFMQVGVGATSVLGLLALVFGLLKVDTWTKGYYTKRLFIGVPAIIIGGFLLIVFIDAAS